MLLNCPHCKSPVPGSEINIPDNIAKCTGEYIPGQRDPRLMLQVAKQLEKMPAFLQRLMKDK